MKQTYEIDVITFEDGQKSLIIKMLDPKKYLAAVFLMSDIQGGDPSWALETIDEVLREEKEFAELNGNICCVEIYKDKTKIFDNLAEDGMGEWCELDTKELKDLIIIWSNEVKKFRESQMF